MSFFGSKPKPQQPPPVTPLPDMQDAAIRQRQADALTGLLRRRGRSSTLLSGRTGDQSVTNAVRPLLGRGTPS